MYFYMFDINQNIIHETINKNHEIKCVGKKKQYVQQCQQL